VSGDAIFAHDFFAQYIQGHEVVDYKRLLERAGFLVKAANPGAVWAGDVDVQGSAGGLRITSAVPFGSPAYDAGLERDDVIQSVGGRRLGSSDTLASALHERKPGDALEVVFERRDRLVKSMLRPGEEPRIEIVPVEDDGGRLTEAQRRFRAAWLSSRRPKF